MAKPVSLKKKEKKTIKFVTLLKCFITGSLSIVFGSYYILHKKITNARQAFSEIHTQNDPSVNTNGAYLKEEIAISNEHSEVNGIERKPSNLEEELRLLPPVLTAYIEKTDFDQWEKKPLPTRETKASDLEKISFHQLKSCSDLPGQWPVDDYPDSDPFLPWIHDVFPSDDGHFIRFVAQNKRRCNTGQLMKEIKKQMQPQISLFQTVPVKRVSESPTRYRLSSYEEADEDGMETRFICRFKPSMQETLSTFPVNYDYHTFRKGYKATFTKEGFDNHMIWTSQLMFDCPVPPELRSRISDGSTVLNDYATMFVDLVPIRTPVRYDTPVQFLPPRYGKPNTFDPQEEWGDAHFLPLIEDSGRWENIPICKPTLQTYGLDEEPELPPDEDTAQGNTFKDFFHASETTPFSTTLYQPQKKVHGLVACTWASTSFRTRGDKAKINDGKRRLFEWLTFHFLSGFDHIYIYDNSGAFTKDDSLKSITDLFPGRVTRINWPSQVCNNRPNNVDNKGERSSQYAAETSCRLRFGAHSKWIGAMDTDEYLVPVNKFSDMKDVLNAVGDEGINILSFHSQRARPRFDVMKAPHVENGAFDIGIKEDSSFFETYNCHRDRPRTEFVPAEKQVYRSDYVLLHHIHYSTMTMESQLNELQTKNIGNRWRQRYGEKHVKFIDEEKEGLMLHTKSVVKDQTKYFERNCKSTKPAAMGQCKLGFPWPNGVVSSENVQDTNGNVYNCFVDERIENVWIPKFKAELKKYPNVQF